MVIDQPQKSVSCLVKKTPASISVAVVLLVLIPAGLLSGYFWGNFTGNNTHANDYVNGFNDGVNATKPRVASVLFTVDPNVFVNWKMNDSYTNSSWLVNASISFMVIHKSVLTDLVMKQFIVLEAWYRNSTGNSTVENYPELSNGDSQHITQDYSYGLFWNTTTKTINPMNITFYNEQADDLLILQTTYSFTNVSMSQSIDDIYYPNKDGNGEYSASMSSGLFNTKSTEDPMGDFGTILSESGSGSNVTTADWIQVHIIDYYNTALLPYIIPLSTVTENIVNIGNITTNQRNDPDALNYNDNNSNNIPLVTTDITINNIHYEIYNNFTHAVV